MLNAEKNNKEIIHTSGSAGGVLVGRRHSEGGIKAFNKSTGKPLEMEGGEVVITRNAVSDTTKYEFEGEMLTNREILSRINVSGGGVSFADGGEIESCNCMGNKYNYGGEVLEDYEILHRMAKGGNVSKKTDSSPSFALEKVSRWEDVPNLLKVVKSVKRVSFQHNEKDKSLLSLMSKFTSYDELRTAMKGVYFDEKCIVATDTHKLLCIPNKGDVRGLFKDGLRLEARFPDYNIVIPDRKNVESCKINAYVFKSVLSSYIEGEYTNMVAFSCVFKFKGFNIGVNARMAIECLDAMIALGHEELYLSASEGNKPMVFSASSKYKVGMEDMCLLMPVLVNDKTLGATDMDFSVEASYYFDAESNSIKNADGSTADFEIVTDGELPYPAEAVSFLKKVVNRNNSIPITESVNVKDKHLYCTTLDTWGDLLMIGANVPDGMYKVLKSGVLRQETNYSHEDFPTLKLSDTQEIIELGEGDVEKLLTCYDFSSDDEFNERLMGVTVQKKENGGVIFGTDAYTGVKFSIGKSFSETMILPFDKYFKSSLSIFKNKAVDLVWYDTKASISTHNATVTSKRPYQSPVNIYGIIPEFGANKDRKKLQFDHAEYLGLLKKNPFNKKQIKSVGFAKSGEDTLSVIYNYYGEFEVAGIIKGSFSEYNSALEPTEDLLFIMPVVTQYNETTIPSFNPDYLKKVIDTSKKFGGDASLYCNSVSGIYILPLYLESSPNQEQPTKSGYSKQDVIDAIDSIKLAAELTDDERIKEEAKNAIAALEMLL